MAEVVEMVTRIFLALHQQCFLWKEQAAEVGTGEALGKVCTFQGSLSFLWSFLKKEQKGRKEEKGKRCRKNRGGKEILKPLCFHYF